MPQDNMKLQGQFTVVCRDPKGRVKWRAQTPNTVVTVGRNLLLSTLFAGAAYTVTGPFMGLISSTSFSAIVASDTMASHAGWLEAGAANLPHYSGNRKTCVWASAAAGAIALSAALVFTITAAGTAEGAFITLGAGAVNTVDDTNGTLFSATIFTGGAKVVGIGDTLSVSYTLTSS